jgi:hypothetical protein
MKSIEIVKAIKNADLSCNGVEERKILDLAINMAIMNDGKYMCPFNSLYFNLTDKQINYINSLIISFESKYSKKPLFGCIINGIWSLIDLRVYSKFIQGSNRYENKKYLLLYTDINI